MRRLAAICVLAALLFAGCSANKAKPDQKQTQETQAPARTLPMAVPSDTFMLARMDLEQVRSAYEHINSLARTAAESEAGPRPDDIPTLNSPAKVLLTALLTAESGWPRSIGNPDALPAEYMQGLDDGGTVYVAVSTAGSEPLMRAMRNRVPSIGPETIPRGYFVRMRLPASDPQALEGWFRKTCELGELPCDSSFALERGADAVTVDFRLGSASHLLEMSDTDPTLPRPVDDEEFLEQPTAATHAFLDTPAALGVYLRSERLAAVGALQGMVEALRALEHASPSNKQALYQRGIEIAGNMFRMVSPEAREVADSAFLLSTPEGGGFVVDAVQGFTEQGARVAEAAEATVSAGTLDGEAAIRAEIAYDVSKSRAAAVTPGWMRTGPANDARDVARILRNSGIWAYALAAHSYPAGFGRGATSLAVAEGGEEAIVANQLEYFEGARIALDLTASERSPIGIEPRGGLIAVFDRRADIEGWAEQGNEALARAPFPMSLEVVEAGDAREIRLLFGEGASVGEPTEIPSTLEAFVDLGVLSETLSGGEVPDLDARRATALASPVLSELGSVELESRRAPAAFHMRLKLGGGEVEPFELRGAKTPAVQVEPAAPCLEEARRESADFQRALSSMRSQNRPEAMRKTAARLGEHQKDCPEHADDIRWMRARWLELAGTHLANRLDWRQAVGAFEAGCELGDEDACDLADRAREPSMGANFASVDGPVSTWSGTGGVITVVGAKRIHRWQFQWPLGVEAGLEYGLEELDLSGRDGRETVARALGDSAPTGYPTAVDADADAYVVALLAQEAHEEQKTGYQRFRRSNNREIGLLVPVEVEGRPGLGRLELFGAAEKLGSHLRLAISSDGVQAFRVDAEGRTAIDAFDGCDPSGPPVCADAKLSDPQVVIEVERGVGFQELAGLSAQIQALRTESGQAVQIRLATD